MKEKREPFTLKKRARSFGFAFNGILTLLKSEHNAWIHLAATIAVVAASFFFHICLLSWFMLITAIVLVWVAEAINTAIEFVVDLVSPDFHPLAKKAKDVAAGAVLMAAIFAVIIGILVVYNEYFLQHTTTCSGL